MLHYAECWIYDNIATVHTGIVGDIGESEETSNIKDENTFLNDFQKEWAAKGYASIQEEYQSWVVLQWPMKTPSGNAQDRKIRDSATQILNEHLGWLGLGHVDGFDMGKTSNPKEEFALNIFCVIVDDEIAVKSIMEILPSQVDCSRLKIAIRHFNEEEFVLCYTANEYDDTFYS